MSSKYRATKDAKDVRMHLDKARRRK